jgi:hypothetical protein
MKTVIVLLSTLLLSVSFAIAQPNAKKDVKADRKLIEKQGADFDWLAFNKRSVVTVDSIKPAAMQGIWKAYYGLFRFGTMVNSMNLTTPFIIEISGSQIKRSATSALDDFTITGNKLTTLKGKDTGYINVLTATLLTITWQNEGNVTRYYYEKE